MTRFAIRSPTPSRQREVGVFQARMQRQAPGQHESAKSAQWRGSLAGDFENSVRACSGPGKGACVALDNDSWKHA
eukprot:8956409-Alexandrium_andersonii.AAC.1